MNIKPLRDNVFFQFLDPTSNTRFGGKTRGGIELPTIIQEQTGVARWGQVTAIGPEVHTEEIKVGAYVLIEAGRWSSGFKAGDEKHWQTREEWCIAVSDQPNYNF